MITFTTRAFNPYTQSHPAGLLAQPTGSWRQWPLVHLAQQLSARWRQTIGQLSQSSEWAPAARLTQLELGAARLDAQLAHCEDQLARLRQLHLEELAQSFRMDPSKSI